MLLGGREGTKDGEMGGGKRGRGTNCILEEGDQIMKRVRE